MTLKHSSNSKKIGIIVPSFFESQFIKREGVDAEFGVSGMGKLRAAWTVRTMHDEGCKAVLLTGFAGGIAKLKKGDVVSAAKVFEGDYDARPFEDFPHSVHCQSVLPKGAKLGYFVSQDRFLTHNAYRDGKNVIGLGNILATDMEAYAVAFAGASLGIPVFIVKMVSDLVDGEAESDFLSACTQMSGRLNDVISESISLIRKKVFDEENG